MSKQIAEQTSRVSFSVGGSTLESFDELTDEWGVSRSEALRELMQNAIEREESTSGYVTPDDPELADAYRTLVNMASEKYEGAGLRVSKTRAVNELYGTNLPKDAVMREVIHPLRERGFVDVDPAMSEVWITVRPPTATDGGADDG